MNLSVGPYLGLTADTLHQLGAVRTTAASKDDQVPSLLEGLSGWDGTQGTMYTGQDTI